MESSWSNTLLVLYKCSTNYLVISTSLAALAVVFVFLWKDSAIFDRLKRKQNSSSQNDETYKNKSNSDKAEEDSEKSVVGPSLMSRIKTARHQLIVNKLTANMTEEQLQEEKDEIKILNTQQAKISVETSKEVANDKTLKTKGEKDRRLREKKQNNIKRFMDEKKTATIKQSREKEKLKITHDKQLEDLSKDIDNLIEMYKMEEAEYEMSSKTEFFA